MNAVSPARSVAPPIQHGEIAGASPAGTQGSLLPDPDTPTAGGMQDAMSLLYVLITKLDDASSAASKQGVVTQTAAKKVELKKAQDALNKQIQAKKDQESASHGFWHTLGKIAGVIGDVVGVVAVAAASVVTFGTVAAIAVVAMSVAGTVLKDTGIGGAVGQWVGMGLSLGASVCTLGASSACEAAGAAGEAASTAEASVKTASNVLSAAADVSSGVGATANGVANGQMDRAAADADDAAADGVRAKQQLDEHQGIIEGLLDVMKAVHDSHKGALQSLQQAMQTNGQTGVAVAAQIGRA